MNSISILQKKLRRHMPELRRRFHVRTLGIFGSYVRNEPRKSSDIDILVEFSKTPNFFEYLELEESLTKLLGKKVDLVMKSALKPIIGKNILREVIYL